MPLLAGDRQKKDRSSLMAGRGRCPRRRRYRIRSPIAATTKTLKASKKGRTARAFGIPAPWRPVPQEVRTLVKGRIRIKQEPARARRASARVVTVKVRSEFLSVNQVGLMFRLPNSLFGKQIIIIISPEQNNKRARAKIVVAEMRRSAL